ATPRSRPKRVSTFSFSVSSARQSAEPRSTVDELNTPPPCATSKGGSPFLCTSANTTLPSATIASTWCTSPGRNRSSRKWEARSPSRSMACHSSSTLAIFWIPVADASVRGFNIHGVEGDDAVELDGAREVADGVDRVHERRVVGLGEHVLEQVAAPALLAQVGLLREEPHARAA